MQMDENASFLTRLAADQNGDGQFTIGDIGPWLMQLLLLPGDGLLSMIIHHTPGVAGFLELGPDDYGGTLAIVLAVLFWLAALILGGMLLNAVHSIDRSLTAWLRGQYSTCLRMVRASARRARIMLASIFVRRRDDGLDFVVDDISLDRVETSVLRCLTQIDDGAVMTPAQLAARLQRPGRELKQVVARLTELELIAAASDSLTDSKGYRIAPTGQMYLLGA